MIELVISDTTRISLNIIVVILAVIGGLSIFTFFLFSLVISIPKLNKKYDVTKKIKKHVGPSLVVVLIFTVIFIFIGPVGLWYFGLFEENKLFANADTLGYYGAVIGGVVTVLGVYWTLKHETEKSKEERRESSLPIFTFSINLNSENNRNSYHDIGSFVFGNNLKDKFKDKLSKRLEEYHTKREDLRVRFVKTNALSNFTQHEETRKKAELEKTNIKSELNKLDKDINTEVNKQEICKLYTSFILSINNIGLQSAILSTIKFIPKGIMSSYNESEIININYLSVPKGKTTELKFIFDWYFKNQNGLSTEFQEAGDLELKYTDLYSNPYEYNIPIKIKREIAQDENKNFIVQFNIIIDKEQLPVRPKGYS